MDEKMWAEFCRLSGLTRNGVPFTKSEAREYEWQNYARWAVGPLMSREQFLVKWDASH